MRFLNSVILRLTPNESTGEGKQPVQPPTPPVPSQHENLSVFNLAATNGWLSRAVANWKLGGKDRCVISFRACGTEIPFRHKP